MKNAYNKNQDIFGLNISRPKPGFGGTHDANTVRRFFKNSEKSEGISNIDTERIKTMDIKLNVMAPGYEISIDKFRELCNILVDTFQKSIHVVVTTNLHEYFIYTQIFYVALIPNCCLNVNLRKR